MLHCMDDTTSKHGIAVIQNTEYVTVSKACEILQCSDKYIYKLADSGKIESIPPQPMLIKLDSLLDYA